MAISAYPQTPRLVNRFTLGTDPEFSFHLKGKYVHAENCGLTTLRGFGCDMAGRQAEIRAYPSRFALEVVASVVDSLRWMGHVHAQEIMPLKWMATAFNGYDGCGGHIHFGRRRPNRDAEVQTLDATTKALLDLGVFNKTSFKNRQEDKHNYGKYGDVRLASHGFEYRTLPTGLSSPWLTYFVMVINKLALYHNEKWLMSKAATEKDALDLLRIYASVDDDAAIALQALRVRGLPAEYAEDFKPFWGLPEHDPLHIQSQDFSGHFFPSSIKSEDQTCLELFEYLTQGTPLPKRVPIPTWEPYRLPKGFHEIEVQRHTLGHLPDVGMNLVSKDAKISLTIGDYFCIYHDMPLPTKQIKEALSSLIGEVRFAPLVGRKDIMIAVPRAFNQSLTQCKGLQKILGNPELFPACAAKNLHKVDWSRWDNNVSTVKPMLGKLVAQVAGSPKEPPIQQAGYSYSYEYKPRLKREEDF